MRNVKREKSVSVGFENERTDKMQTMTIADSCQTDTESLEHSSVSTFYSFNANFDLFYIYFTQFCCEFYAFSAPLCVIFPVLYRTIVM